MPLPLETERKIYSITELTRSIKKILEETFPFIWVSGEITNLSRAGSGHLYFSLKDATARLPAVMFQGQARRLGFSPENGLNVMGFGRISLYEPRGAYQIILEYLSPEGIGALQLAFEQLKKKLTAEGLFDPEHKKKPPALPRRVCLITSTAGAVLHDFVRIAHRRFPGLAIEVIPARVQGAGAENELADALALASRRNRADVIVLARGGGSLEDLACFNAEILARAIFDSKLPVVSAVGHETDFTIADFVADLRAPTPSAAAEILVPLKSDLLAAVDARKQALIRGMRQFIADQRQAVLWQQQALVNPAARIRENRERLDALRQRLRRVRQAVFEQNRLRLAFSQRRLQSFPLQANLHRQRQVLQASRAGQIVAMHNVLSARRSRWRHLHHVLCSLSPLNILSRGYSITRLLPQGKIINDAGLAGISSQIEITLHQGRLTATVTGQVDTEQETR